MNYYYALLNDVLANGRDVNSRNGDTLEMLNYSFTITPDVLNVLPTGIGRRVSTRVAVVEAAQLIGGFSDPPALVNAAARFKDYMDGGVFWGGYGTRIAAQLPPMVQKLTRDPDTRQAQVTFWDAAYDNAPDMRDYPCTTSIQFMIRDRRLCAFVHMRSNDAFRGVPYDVFQFTQLQRVVASVLGVGVGDYYHHASSMHIYYNDINDAIDVMDTDITTVAPDVPDLFGKTMNFVMYDVKEMAETGQWSDPKRYGAWGKWYADMYHGV